MALSGSGQQQIQIIKVIIFACYVIYFIIHCVLHVRKCYVFYKCVVFNNISPYPTSKSHLIKTDQPEMAESRMAETESETVRVSMRNSVTH